MSSTQTRLRVWHITNPPRETFFFPVETVPEALVVLGALAKYDLYLDQVFGEEAVFLCAQGLEFFNQAEGTWDEVKPKAPITRGATTKPDFQPTPPPPPKRKR